MRFDHRPLDVPGDRQRGIGGFAPSIRRELKPGREDGEPGGRCNLIARQMELSKNNTIKQ